jgi:hypothetical protein
MTIMVKVYPPLRFISSQGDNCVLLLSYSGSIFIRTVECS